MLFLIFFITILAVCIYKYFALVRIDGNSMYPTLKSGQIYLCTRVLNTNDVQIGGVYVCERPNLLVVKRVTRKLKNNKSGTYVFLEGDNKAPGASHDSRDYGYIHSSEIKYRLRESWRIV